MKLKQGCLLLAVATLVVACLAVGWFAWRYESLNDDPESIVLTPAVPDITYCTMGGIPQHLDLYFPPARDGGKLPLLVYVHGGGWTGGDKRKGSGIVDIPAMTGRGFAVAAVNYRRAPEWKFPAPLNDVKCAIRFLRANADQYGFDVNRVGIWGGSAGGQLAAFVGLTDPRAGFDVGEYLDRSSRVRAVADLFGPTDLTADFTLLQKLLLYRAFETIDPNTAILKQASPLRYVTPDAPPFLILQGDQDDAVPLSQSQVFYERLKAAGADATLVVVKNANHNFAPTGGPISPSREELSRILGDFFVRVLTAVQ